MPEPHLDEELAWEPDLPEWSCPSCTLLNAPECPKCVACESLRPGSGNRVVVVLPRTEQPVLKRSAEEEDWACPACTLLNAAAAVQCGACGGERWIQKRPMTAAALRARKGSKETGTDRTHPSGDTHSATLERGIWGGLGPDREFLPLPPAPEGRIVYRSAKDSELDMFGEGPEVPEETEKTERSENNTQKDHKDERSGDLVETEGFERPSWRIEGTPLFASTDTTLAFGLGESALFEDAVARLASTGVEYTKCVLALEAAGGDEDLARNLLIGSGATLQKRWSEGS